MSLEVSLSTCLCLQLDGSVVPEVARRKESAKKCGLGGPSSALDTRIRLPKAAALDQTRPGKCAKAQTNPLNSENFIMICYSSVFDMFVVIELFVQRCS